MVECVETCITITPFGAYKGLIKRHLETGNKFYRKDLTLSEIIVLMKISDHVTELSYSMFNELSEGYDIEFDCSEIDKVITSQAHNTMDTIIVSNSKRNEVEVTVINKEGKLFVMELHASSLDLEELMLTKKHCMTNWVIVSDKNRMHYDAIYTHSMTTDTKLIASLSEDREVHAKSLVTSDTGMKLLKAAEKLEQSTVFPTSQMLGNYLNPVQAFKRLARRVNMSAGLTKNNELKTTVLYTYTGPDTVSFSFSEAGSPVYRAYVNWFSELVIRGCEEYFFVESKLVEDIFYNVGNELKSPVEFDGETLKELNLNSLATKANIIIGATKVVIEDPQAPNNVPFIYTSEERLKELMTTNNYFVVEEEGYSLSVIVHRKPTKILNSTGNTFDYPRIETYEVDDYNHAVSKISEILKGEEGTAPINFMEIRYTNRSNIPVNSKVFDDEGFGVKL